MEFVSEGEGNTSTLKETKTTHNMEYKGYNTTFSQPTRPKKRQGYGGKGKKTILKATEMPRSPRRSLRSKSREVKYNFSDTDERDPEDMDPPVEVQGYI